MERPSHPEGRSCRPRNDQACGGAAVAERLRLVRLELFGEQGIPALARRLGLPARTWSNYERGVTIPGIVVLLFLEATGVEPSWLLRVRGPRYRPPGTDVPAEPPEEGV